ncbi:MAG: CAP domain-containing protein [Dehalococcoidia bacterium]|nr:CAP domain-containing protein [Dehalococcoidia bacterium]MDD5493695.1 CAP domain-containing protein [Dehalococcoidia bacterium]
MSTGKWNFVIGVSLLLTVILLIGCSTTPGKIKVKFGSKNDSNTSSDQEQTSQSTPSYSKPQVKDPEIVFFTSDLTKITSGEHTALNWNVTGATKVSIDQGVGTVNSQRGSKEISPTADTVYKLTATNSAGSVTKTVTVTVTEPGPVTSHLPAPPEPSYTPPATSSLPSTLPPVISFFSAGPAAISAGGCSTLSWLVSGATSITINPGGTVVTASGSAPVCPAATTSFTLTATNAAGSVSSTATVTVSAAPPVPAAVPVINSFSASPGSVTAGNCSTLSWLVSGATSIAINQGVGAVPASGTASVCPAATTTFSLTATNAAGSVTSTAVVTVSAAPPPGVPPVINSFTASPGSISSGDCSTLSWNVSGALTITINPGGMSVGASGTSPVCPAATTGFTLTATNAAGSVSSTATVTVGAAPPPPPGDATTCEQALFDAVNAVRAAHGRAALTRNSYIDGLCRTHAAYMAAANALSHDNFLDRANLIRTNIPGMNPCAENVLQNNIPCDAADMANQWETSPGHHDNMVNASYTISGMGIVIDGGGKIWACQLFAGP